MPPTVAYSPVSIKSISSSLAALFSGGDDKGSKLLRSSNVNSIILVPSPKSLGPLEELLESFSLAHPGRIFVLCMDDTATSVKAEIAARCVMISKSESICCEVVRLTSSPQLVSAVPSIIRGNLLTGVATELFIFEQPVDDALLYTIAPFADQIVIDSSIFEKDLNQVAIFLRMNSQLVDLQWISCSPWRDQIRALVDRFSGEELMDRLDKVTIKAETHVGCADPQRDGICAIPSCALLMAGWVVDRLGLEAVAYSKAGFECRYVRGALESSGLKNITLAIDITSGKAESRLIGVDFAFAARGARGGALMSLRRGESLEGRVALSAGAQNRSFKISAPLEDNSIKSRFERYFTIGESMTNYRSALKAALELDELRRGFTGGI